MRFKTERLMITRNWPKETISISSELNCKHSLTIDLYVLNSQISGLNLPRCILKLLYKYYKRLER